MVQGLEVMVRIRERRSCDSEVLIAVAFTYDDSD
jgi:hypothetical protein